MAEPVQYESFGKMMIDHAPFVIAGVVAIIGLTMGVLHKIGWLKSLEEKEKEKSEKKELCEKCPYVERKRIGSRTTPCADHPTIITAVKEIHETQITMLAQQKTNMSKLANGKEEFKTITNRINELAVGVGILLDRTGGRPPGYKES